MTEQSAGGATRANRAFTGIATFMRAPHQSDLAGLDADVAVLGVPFDEGSPFAPGSRFAPRTIREHSMRLGSSGLYDIENDRHYLRELLGRRRLADAGDVDILPSRADLSMANLTRDVAMIRERGARPIVVGGDHTITFPVVRAFDEPIHVIQLDAHLDYFPVMQDMTYTNGQAFRLLHGLGHVKSLTQIGIRSWRDLESNAADARAAGGRIVTIPELRAKGIAAAISHLPAGEACYVSIDVDAYDMPLVPGCVSAEPGGFHFEELRDTLKAIAERFPVRGFDFVEVNPQLDVGTGVTSYLGALTIAMFLGFIEAARS
ncbi:MAG: arginase family protein [Hyphomicrobiaceae bacterium]